MNPWEPTTLLNPRHKFFIRLTNTLFNLNPFNNYIYIYIYIYLFISVALRPNAGYGLILEVSRSHTTTRHSR